MSQHTFQDFVAFDQTEYAKPFDQAIRIVRLTDADKAGLHFTNSVSAYEVEDDCANWVKIHQGNPGNMKVRVYALNHTPPGISGWLDLEQVEAWKAGKITG
jgi:hypothetical protein